MGLATSLTGYFGGQPSWLLCKMHFPQTTTPGGVGPKPHKDFRKDLPQVHTPEFIGHSCLDPVQTAVSIRSKQDCSREALVGVVASPRNVFESPFTLLKRKTHWASSSISCLEPCGKPWRNGYVICGDSHMCLLGQSCLNVVDIAFSIGPKQDYSAISRACPCGKSFGIPLWGHQKHDTGQF